MKKITRLSTALLLLALLWGALGITAEARDLELCYHCGGTGQFRCEVCRNTGEVTCEGCHGEGGSVCPGEPGKGCDGGYYVCPSCGGDTYTRSGDGQIPPDAQPGSCGACGGSGRMRCVICHDLPGWNVCAGCNGTGRQECMAPNCRDSKKADWKCPYCMGAGYLLVGNPMPPASANDGVKNQPKTGDHIITDNKTWEYYVYTGSGGTPTGSRQTAPVTRAPTDPVPTDPVPTGTDPVPTDPVPAGTDPAGTDPAGTDPAGKDPAPIGTEPTAETWTLDLGEGRFLFEGFKPVMIWIDGHTESGTVEVEADTPIRLEDLVPENMTVFLKGEGFSARLIPDEKGNVCLSRRQPPEGEIPRRVQLTVELFNDEVPPDPTEPLSPPVDRTGSEGGYLPLALGIGAGALGAVALILIILKKRKTGAKE